MSSNRLLLVAAAQALLLAVPGCSSSEDSIVRQPTLDANAETQSDSTVSGEAADTSEETATEAGPKDSGADVKDTSIPETGKDTEVEAESGVEAGADSLVDAPPAKLPCKTSWGEDGLQENGVCDSCVDHDDDLACAAAYGGNSLCLAGACVKGECHNDSECLLARELCAKTTRTCSPCTHDSDCEQDPTYGPGTLCINGQCVEGDCSTPEDCYSGKLCSAHQCISCVGDPQCVAAYGAGYKCLGKACVFGSCSTDADCLTGQLCSVKTPNLCSPCSTDTACLDHFGAGTLCEQGRCAKGECHTSADCVVKGQLCGVDAPRTCSDCASNDQCHADSSFGPTTLCVNGKCTVAECQIHADCPLGQLCGVVKPNTCGKCTPGAAGDAKCETEYGAGYLCTASEGCVKGECQASADCSTKGWLCGASLPYTCGGCTSDSQCALAAGFGAGYFCDATSQACVSTACTAQGQVCPGKSTHFCCSSVCVPGDCCVDADCASFGNGYKCLNHVCSQCELPTNHEYYVDPLKGNDLGATGGISCPFRSITGALRFLGKPTVATTILVEPTAPLTTNSGEQFPIVVPAKVVLAGDKGTPTVLVAATGRGFVLAGADSGLRGLTIDGQNRTADYGIVAVSGSAANTFLERVTVRRLLHAGILVGESGKLRIGPGVLSLNNGTETVKGHGLAIQDTGAVTIQVTVGDAETVFRGNSGDGIAVRAGGACSITAPTPAELVQANSNGGNGLSIVQTPGSAPANNITGLVARDNGADGIYVTAGASLVLRGSVILGNSGSGVHVVSNTLTHPHVNAVTGIDLGSGVTASTAGNNTLQGSLLDGLNLYAGICLQVEAGSAAHLKAQGNKFSAVVDCQAAESTLSHKSTCSGGVTVGITGATNTVETAKCTY